MRAVEERLERLELGVTPDELGDVTQEPSVTRSGDAVAGVGYGVSASSRSWRAYEEDALRDREPGDRGEHVDRPLEQAPGGEAEADGDEHHAFDPRAEADVAAQSDRLGLRARVRDEEGADHGCECRHEGYLVPVVHEREPDRGEDRRLADAVERRVEEGAEHRPLARGPGECAVEDVGHRADHEERSAQPEEEVLVPLLEADEHRAGEAEQDAGERQHVRRQLRLRDALHVALENLPRGLDVLLLEAVERVDARFLARGRHAARVRTPRSRPRKRTAATTSATRKPAAQSSQ